MEIAAWRAFNSPSTNVWEVRAKRALGGAGDPSISFAAVSEARCASGQRPKFEVCEVNQGREGPPAP